MEGGGSEVEVSVEVIKVGVVREVGMEDEEVISEIVRHGVSLRVESKSGSCQEHQEAHVAEGMRDELGGRTPQGPSNLRHSW